MYILKRAVILLITVFVLYSCEQNKFINDPQAGIRFSVDTLYFDTVFTELGTATRSFTIHNPHKDYIRISELRLAKGTNSVFRINMDGVPGTDFRDIEIPPGDSLYVFVDATLDPNGNNEILLQQDSIVAFTNNRTQDIDLVAWGQDVHLLRAETLSTQTWINDKPYLVIDYVYVDSLEVLTLEPGVQVYLHRDAIFAVGGTLIADGELENPVKFSGDRLEALYEDVPGQWGGIWMFAGSKDNIMDYVEIKGATFGMIVDTFMNDNPTLIFTNSVIRNISSVGLLARGSRIVGYNDVLANCGSSALALIIGGSYEFNHITVANSSFGTPLSGGPPRNEPSVYLSNYYLYKDANDVTQVEIRDIEKASFGNSIIWGSHSNELFIDKYPDEGTLNYFFDHCIIRYNQEDLQVSDEFFPGLISEDPGFISWEDYDFQLDTLSIAKDAGKLEIGNLFPVDLLGNSRIADLKPDIGAYERIED